MNTLLLSASMTDILQILVGICAWIAYSLGIFYTLGRWGISRNRRWQIVGLVLVFYGLLVLITHEWTISLIAAVTLCGLVFPVPLHRLRFLDGLGVWMPVGAAIALGGKDWHSLPVIAAQLILLLGFIALRQVYGPKAYSRFGQMYFAALALCGLGLSWNGALLAGLIAVAIGSLGWAWASFVEKPEDRPLVLFDLDGTLIDSQQLVFETFRQVFARLKPGYPLSEQELYSFFGPTLETTFGRYFSEDEIPDVIDLYQKINLELHPQLLSQMPHAREMLESLSSQGYRMAIVSNKRRHPVEYGLELTGLTPYFEAVFAKEDQPKPKPAPDGLIHAALELNTPLDQVVYVGDNAADIQAARNTAFFSTGYTQDETQFQALQKEKPCRILRDLRQMETIVKEDSLWIDKQIW